MRHVDQHAAAVHLRDQTFPEGTQPTPGPYARTTVTDLIISAMSQGHIAHAAPVELIQQLEGLLQGRGILDTEQDARQAGLAIAAHAAGAARIRDAPGAGRHP